jgi:hypothetical protein
MRTLTQARSALVGAGCALWLACGAAPAADAAYARLPCGSTLTKAPPGRRA